MSDLDHLTALVEDIRNLLSTLVFAAPGITTNPPAAAAESPAPDSAAFSGAGHLGLTHKDVLTASMAARLWSTQSGDKNFWLDLADRFRAVAKSMEISDLGRVPQPRPTTTTEKGPQCQKPV
ncbi:hypothetical protein VIMS_02493 [Mycobacterium marinum]|uniref:hypothetical protein n=1 Tax=Mycobacterium marinum TaxID=1781 RepID=UPI000E3C547C|nr:hypothetical protein [Mycobacterium marinum]RFZ15063.1 hypothetical protein VIMS_02493 [Mycobacterium marinum]